MAPLCLCAAKNTVMPACHSRVLPSRFTLQRSRLTVPHSVFITPRKPCLATWCSSSSSTSSSTSDVSLPSFHAKWVAQPDVHAAIDALMLRYADWDPTVLATVVWMPMADPQKQPRAVTRFQLGQVLRATDGWLGNAIAHTDVLTATLAGAAGKADDDDDDDDDDEIPRPTASRREAAVSRVAARARRKRQRAAALGLGVEEGEPEAGEQGSLLLEKARALQRDIHVAGLAAVGKRALAARAADSATTTEATEKDDVDEEWSETSSGIAYVDAAVDSLRVYLEYSGTPRPIPYFVLQNLEALVIAAHKIASGEAEEDEEEEERVRYAVRRRLEPLSTKPTPKHKSRAKLMRRYHAAKLRKEKARVEWRAQSRDLRHARMVLSRANHELARLRKHLPTEWRV